MVKKAGKDGYRSFTVINVSKHGGCKTKFHSGRYINKTPAGAARKAFTEFCRTKRIKGICTLNVVVQETTTGSRKGVFAYNLHRHKLAKPMIMQEGTDNEYVIEYKSTIKSIKTIPEDCKNPGQSRGRMKRHTAKKYKMTGNNVRKGRKRGSIKRKEMFR